MYLTMRRQSIIWNLLKLDFKIIKTVAFICIVFSLSCSTNENTNHHTKPDKGVFGIDVSHHQKQIDWKKVKSSKKRKIEFVYVKATEGASYEDKNYKKYFYEAKENGFLVGSYHYFRTTSSVEEQFRNFSNTVFQLGISS
jgi:lysozyme